MEGGSVSTLTSSVDLHLSPKYWTVNLQRVPDKGLEEILPGEIGGKEFGCILRFRHMLVKGVKRLNDLGVCSGLRQDMLVKMWSPLYTSCLQRLTIMWQLHNIIYIDEVDKITKYETDFNVNKTDFNVNEKRTSRGSCQSSSDRVAIVVDNVWKDVNAKVRHVKQWLEKRRCLQIGYEEKNMYMGAYDWRHSFQNTEVKIKGPKFVGGD
ncbi:hypothetical protein CASFOL_037352 [Castilleja foliolosa]|uniref:Uncharacterized protein n=1 Tax=Castilleja foliolosa TaxID=1961234 RepID=A0ABD3BNP8_9LAMI